MESAEFEPEQLQGGPSVASAARLSPRANPPFSKQPSNSKLGTDNRDYSSPIPTDDSQSSDKKRKSGGASSISKSLAAEELRNQYDSDRANLRKMINDKRKQTPQQDAEVVIVANQDYDDFVETHKQRYSNAAAHPPSTQVTPQPSISPQPSVTPRRDENSVQNVQNKESQLVLESIDSHGSPPNNKEMSNTMRLNASVAFDNCCNLWSKMVPAANAKIVPASPISRRQMAFELEEEAGDEGSVVLAQDSKSVAEAAVDETFEEAGFEESFEGDESYLGQSFVTELNGNAFENLANPQAALEYSMMLQQMQEILQLPSHPNIGAKALEKIEEGSEEEDIEEGFEEESVKFDLSDSDDDEGHAHGQDFEIEGEDEVEKNNESLEEIEPLVDEGKYLCTSHKSNFGVSNI